MNLRLRLLKIVDGLLAALILVTVTGTSLAFGGAVWWAKPALAVTTSLMIVASLARCLLDGRWIVLKSPLAMLGLFAIGLALIQLTPMPGRIASLLSPQARAAHALGTLPDLAKADDPDAVIPESAASRTPATLDRPATHWSHRPTGNNRRQHRAWTRTPPSGAPLFRPCLPPPIRHGSRTAPPGSEWVGV